ncbi:hypothetical protein BvCmsF30A_00670 [Escherichia coli]|uniref:DUF1627 domain-containing protein n=3 Tax=Escherichia coli TaxID=562 RepID=UPI000773FFC1|nr:DUF1627 domain-containing protein [Escherichia coli]EEY3542310.1 DUF1627 domain-containing protein [Escherichia coli]EEY3549210.1 DUF1627 domain-containing protein [Escherichia coli]EEY3552305.1 DUF1627 domain-containing protein [Escherichia coli]EEY3562829.1 DUF1627 domain-containing protein [Escherichia coli]EEY3573965.1 DUF1627 domain-containing protein [Escherichia coli]
METLIDTLKAMQKVTCTELATSLGIAPAEAIKMLREYEEQGEVVSVNGYWSVSERQSGVKEKTVPVCKAERKSRMVVSRKDREPLNRCDILSTLAHGGAMTTAEIAIAVGRADCVRSLVSAMEKLCRDGMAIKLGQGKGCKWMLVKETGENLPAEPKFVSVAKTPGKAFSRPAGVALPVQEVATQEDIKTETVADIAQSLPSFTETRANDLILPSLHMANRELRRAKNHVRKWERVCAALRELNKHRDIVRQMNCSREDVK